MKSRKIFLGFLSLLFLLPLTSCSTGKRHEAEEYMLELDYHDNFKILQLSDLHIAFKDDRDRQYNHIVKTIDAAKEEAGNLDLIVISGDLFTFATKSVAKELFKVLDSCEVPWTCTFGNHDEQCYFSIDWLTGYLNELSNNFGNGSYCRFKDIQDDDVYGNANFVINLVETTDNVKHIREQVYIMDSNRYRYYSDGFGYDVIRDSQIEWYGRMADATSTKEGGAVPSVMFFHIPLVEFEACGELVEEHMEDETITTADGIEYLSGISGEGVSSPDQNSGLYDMLVEKESCRGIFVGHDHVSNWICKYSKNEKNYSMLFGYGVNTTDRVYFDEPLLGGSIYTLINPTALNACNIPAYYLTSTYANY